MANQSLEVWLLEEFVKLGVSGYTVIPCTGAGRRQLAVDTAFEVGSNVRIEVITTHEMCNSLVEFLCREILETPHITACVETIDVVCVGQFTSPETDGGANH